MGQAKLRGTKDDRVAEAIARQAEAKRAADEYRQHLEDAQNAARVEMHRRAEAGLSPEAITDMRMVRHKRNLQKAQILGLLAGMSMPPPRRAIALKSPLPDNLEEFHKHMLGLK